MIGFAVLVALAVSLAVLVPVTVRNLWRDKKLGKMFDRLYGPSKDNR